MDFEESRMPWIYSGENNQMVDFSLGGVETGTVS